MPAPKNEAFKLKAVMVVKDFNPETVELGEVYSWRSPPVKKDDVLVKAGLCRPYVG